MPVILINPFTVAADHEAAFLDEWHATAARVRSAPGFLGTRMHRSLDPAAPFRFVNVAQWESEAAWRAAFAAGGAPREIGAGVTARPALFEVVADIAPG